MGRGRFARLEEELVFLIFRIIESLGYETNGQLIRSISCRRHWISSPPPATPAHQIIRYLLILNIIFVTLDL